MLVYPRATAHALRRHCPEADPGFQARGVHLKKLRRAEGDANIFGVFPPLDPPLLPAILYTVTIRLDCGVNFNTPTIYITRHV